jgi:hypothetical protein
MSCYLLFLIAETTARKERGRKGGREGRRREGRKRGKKRGTEGRGGEGHRGFSWTSKKGRLNFFLFNFQSAKSQKKNSDTLYIPN